jgi:hypothetical protein
MDYLSKIENVGIVTAVSPNQVAHATASNRRCSLLARGALTIFT